MVSEISDFIFAEAQFIFVLISVSRARFSTQPSSSACCYSGISFLIFQKYASPNSCFVQQQALTQQLTIDELSGRRAALLFGQFQSTGNCPLPKTVVSHDFFLLKSFDHLSPQAKQMARVWARLSNVCDDSSRFLGDETALAGNDPTQVNKSPLFSGWPQNSNSIFFQGLQAMLHYLNFVEAE